MARHGFLLFQGLSLFLFLIIGILRAATAEDREEYIVYMGALPEGEYFPSAHHQSILQEVVEGSSVQDIMVRNYKRSFNGFAAKLTDSEKQKLAGMNEVVSVFPSRTLQLHTTRSWDFTGFYESVSRKSSDESDIIVGVIDTGIWPESESFSDEGFGPAPKKWKGACKGGQNFTCNNKIIGARYYSSLNAYTTSRDEEGHGSHTASIAAGNSVKDASFFGLGEGIARGGVPSSRIAAYKVCSLRGCQESDLLAAFDDAIDDGVDIITISIGGSAIEFTDDSIAIGAFHAMAKGILTINSSGNSGPNAGVISSVAPWLMSVAASTTDRLFVDKVILGNEETIVGHSINAFTLKGEKYPLIYGKGASNSCDLPSAQACTYGRLDSEKVKGKIVLCDLAGGYIEAHRAGATGSIFKNERSGSVSFVVSLPALGVNSTYYENIISYMNSTEKPEVEILKTQTFKDPDAPVVAYFSSRGPNIIAPDILKPDISAPGVDIVAAWSPLGSVSEDGADKRRAKYNIVSGTSMSCPYVAGVAAYVKSFHLDWSPSAIKSAVMTTAWPMNSSKITDAEFAYGSGHVNPVKAIDPGLVYETSEQDYVKFLCGLGYNVGIISGVNSSCPKGSDKTSPKDLNYPSMAALVSSEKSFTINFPRTVTNVGVANSTYRAEVLENPKISIKVVPEVLSFTSLNERKSFNVTVTGTGLPDQAVVSASLVWSDGNHSVKSPIVVHTKYFA